MKDLIAELNSDKVFIVEIDESLKAFANDKRVSKKLERMNHILATTELPKEYFMDENVTAKTSTIAINPNAKRYDSVGVFPETLALVNEPLAKYGEPKNSKEKEDAFWIEGILSQVDTNTSTFLIVDNQTNISYSVTTSAEVLTQLVKDYWGNTVELYIKAKVQNDTARQYELIEIS